MRMRNLYVAWGLGLMIGVSGCGAPANTTDFVQGPRSPDRPAELDRLSDWVGGWSTEVLLPAREGEEPTRLKLNQSFEWVLDKRFLRENLQGEIDGAAYRRVVMTTWDSAAGKYRFFSFDSRGRTAQGYRAFEPESRTWYTTSRMQEPNGQVTVGEETSKFVDDNHVLQRFRGWDKWKLHKTSETESFSRRTVEYEDQDAVSAQAP